uniref:SCP domain-containing protein n=1 Tax=Chromera velia CCMP2878 TaxID=1169474 RepID=A0A0G4HY11_9ALVE|eukprot:Cvel_9389.t1-p1 / transcript=Cvel_9389.t1 / gene=Cvel_9389 / organism=Chromera_velia_CCMP2878 / gene_product=hypothetical protein / transcript_product=hypothetical protein / location=Cvel_scaffold539:53128-58198(-) / protein_length=818 / sequence_SO=supercontig / SO=protein_coding / is_pseudo=false
MCNIVMDFPGSPRVKVAKEKSRVSSVHDAPFLKWDNCLANSAQGWANQGQWALAGALDLPPCVGPAEENMGRRQSSAADVAAMWYAQETFWASGGGGPTKNFKAMVWKGADKLGCGVNPNLGADGPLYVCRIKGSNSKTDCKTPNAAGCEASMVGRRNSKSEAQCEAEAKQALIPVTTTTTPSPPAPTPAPTSAPPSSNSVDFSRNLEGQPWWENWKKWLMDKNGTIPTPPQGMALGMDSSFQSFSDFLKSFSWGDWWKFGQSGEVFAASAETKISSILHSYSGEGTPAGKDMMFEAVAERASWIYNESASLETEGDRVLKLVSLLTGPLQNNPNFPLFLANLTRFGSFIADKALDLADPSSSVYAVHSVAVGIESYAPAELRNTAFFDGFMGNLGALLEGLFKSLFSFGLPFMSPPNCQFAASTANSLFASAVSKVIGMDAEALLELRGELSVRPERETGLRTAPSLLQMSASRGRASAASSPSPVSSNNNRTSQQADVALIQRNAQASTTPVPGVGPGPGWNKEPYSWLVPPVLGPWYIPPSPSGYYGWDHLRNSELDDELYNLYKTFTQYSWLLGFAGDGLMQGLTGLLGGLFNPDGFGGVFSTILCSLMGQLAGGGFSGLFDMFKQLLAGDFLGVFAKLFGFIGPGVGGPNGGGGWVLLKKAVKESREFHGLTALQVGKHKSAESVSGVIAESFMMSVGPGLSSDPDFANFVDRIAQLVDNSVVSALEAGLPYVTPENIAHGLNTVVVPHTQSVVFGVLAGRRLGTSYSGANSGADMTTGVQVMLPKPALIEVQHQEQREKEKERPVRLRRAVQ